MRLALLLVVLVGSVLCSGCDFVISTTVQNRTNFAIVADVNDANRPIVVLPGESGGISPGVNANLDRVRVWRQDDPSDAVVRELNIKNGKYRISVIVTGPPLALDVEKIAN